MSKHTTGPWQARLEPHHGYIVRAADGRPVASLWESGTDCGYNGDLIAAAPEMLEALKKCLVVFEALADAGNYPLPLYGNGGWKFAADAIDKAEGRS